MIHRHDNGAVCVRQHLRRPAGVADIIKQLRQSPVDRRVVQRQLDAVCEQCRTALCQCGRVGVACQTAVIGVLHGEIPPAAPLEQNVQSGTHIYPRQAGMPVAACIGNQPRQVDGIVEHDLQLCHAGTGCQDILQLLQQVRTDAASPVVRLDAQEGKVPAGGEASSAPDAMPTNRLPSHAVTVCRSAPANQPSLTSRLTGSKQRLACA